MTVYSIYNAEVKATNAAKEISKDSFLSTPCEHIP